MKKSSFYLSINLDHLKTQDEQDLEKLKIPAHTQNLLVKPIKFFIIQRGIHIHALKPIKTMNLTHTMRFKYLN